MNCFGHKTLASLIALATFCTFASTSAELIPARHKEGSVRAFLQLLDEDGKHIATGDLEQSVHGGQVISRLLFTFKDGSIDDEQTVFTQHGAFRLVSDHHMQKGPSFPHPLDVDIQMGPRQVTTRTEKDGKPEILVDHLDLPPDLADGLPMILVKNIHIDAAETKVAYLVSMPKPRLIHLAIFPDGSQSFSVGGAHYKATCFRFHVELGGIVGVIAPLIGKEPADGRVWVAEGKEPAFVRAEVPLYDGGPLWTIELARPEWPERAAR